MCVNLTSYLDGVLLPVKAKQAVIAVLAKTFSVPKTQIELIHGLASAKKTFLIRGRTADELRDILVAG